ncbi:hypothetical protein MRX96_010192 [Rhipicephalus microplus]
MHSASKCPGDFHEASAVPFRSLRPPACWTLQVLEAIGVRGFYRNRSWSRQQKTVLSENRAAWLPAPPLALLPPRPIIAE